MYQSRKFTKQVESSMFPLKKRKTNENKALLSVGLFDKIKIQHKDS